MAKKQKQDLNAPGGATAGTANPKTRETLQEDPGGHTLEDGARAIEDALSDEFDAQEEYTLEGHDPEDENDAAEALGLEDDESEDEDPEGDYGDEDEEADEDVDGEDDAEPETHKVKVDGEEIEVTYDELVNGYSRQADYTRKSQAVAEQRREVQQKEQVATQMAESLAQRLEALANAHEQLGLSPEQMQAIQQEYVQARQYQQQQQLDQHMQTLQSERELLTEAIPEWKRDPQAAEKEKSEMMEYAVRDLGYAPEEVNQVADHRAMILLRKAMKYDQIQARAGEVQSKKKTSKTLQPGARQHTSPKAKDRKAIQAASKRLRRSGSVRDAANLFEMTLGEALD